MKVISNCEKQFISNCITKREKRLDGREFTQGRTLEIVLGEERGCCMALLGNTRVLVQVSCEISEPKANNPAVGIVHVNLENSPMAAPDTNKYSRASEEFMEVQRLLERFIRDSKCIELESLCIAAASKVWAIRVDIHPLNDDGNLIECASIAAISALAHFRRPEVTAVGTDITVHSIKEKEPVALNLHHMPISINLALFDQGKHILVDPSDLEEQVCDGCYILVLNAHQEFCLSHRRGVLLLNEEIISRCENVAIKRAQEVTQIIRSALDDDAYKRTTKAPIGFINLIQTGTILGARHPVAEINLDAFQNMPEENNNDEPNEDNIIDQSKNSEEEDRKMVISDTSQFNSDAKERALKLLQDLESTVFEGGHSKWGDDTDDITSEEEEEEIETKPDISAMKEEISSDNEEETAYMSQEQLDVKTPDKRGWFIKDPFS